MANWYYSQDGQQQGPVAQSQLQQMLQSGQLANSSLVWKQGMGDWVAASTLEVFSVTAASSPSTGGGGAALYAAPNSQVQQNYGYQQQVPMGPKPNNYLVQSIILTVLTLILCSGLPIGVVPLVFSILVNSKYGHGDYQGAVSSSATARVWCIVCWSLVAVMALLVGAWIALIVAAVSF